MITIRQTQYVSTALACAAALQATLALAADAPLPFPPIPSVTPPPVAAPGAAVAMSGTYEELPNLDANVILQPQYLQGPNFKVRAQAPTYSGSNYYVIDSDFGVFTANGSATLVRRISEINGIAKLRAMSQSSEFAKAAKNAAKAPLAAGKQLIEDPVSTIAAVPKGIVGFLGNAKEAVKGAVQGRPSQPADGGAIAKISGFSEAKRNLAISVGVDPYSNNEVFQYELQKVAWPAFSGGFLVKLGLAAVPGGAGAAIGAVNLTGTLSESLRKMSPAELRKMNADRLQRIGVSETTANYFLNNLAFSPSIQSIFVDSLLQLGNIPGQTDFVGQAGAVEDEHDALAYLQSAQLMDQINTTSPVTRITQLGGLPVCETAGGGVIIPIQWDYVAWTPLAERFALDLKAWKTATPITHYTLMLTGVASPTATQELTKLGITVVSQALPGPLK